MRTSLFTFLARLLCGLYHTSGPRAKHPPKKRPPVEHGAPTFCRMNSSWKVSACDYCCQNI